MELWESIDKPYNRYYVSTCGRMWSAMHGIMKTPLCSGYPHCNIMVNGREVRVMVHVSVALSFIPNPENKPTVNHKNGIKTDNNKSDLEWATIQEQNIHSVQVLGRKGAINRHRQKNVIAYREDSMIVLEFNGIREAARNLSMPYQAIQRILKHTRKTYLGWMFTN